MAVAYLVLNDNQQTGKVRIDTDVFTVGRHEMNALTLDDHKASRFHAEVVRRGAAWVVRDLKSSNGTKVNSQVVAEAVLESGDLIEIGNTRLRFMSQRSEEDVVEKKGAEEELSLPVDWSPPAARAAAPAQVSAPPAAAVDAAPAARVPAPVTEGGGENGSESSRHSAPPARAMKVEDAMGAEERLIHMAALLPLNIFANDIVILSARGEISLPPVVGKKAPEGGDPVAVLRLLLLVCAASGASDIHIEPRENSASIRIRVDGNMIETCTLTKELGNRLLSMIKVLADLNIAQKAMVQDGNFSARMPAGKGAREGSDSRRVDYRVSFAPSVFGQKLVVRIQDSVNAPGTIEDLLLPADMLEELRVVMEQDSGMVLVSGPTGSGKTTTLYALLRSIDRSQRNITTIENPVEIQIPGITQLPVDESQNKGFAALLRSVLRQDPDVILVGEIRDEETAQTAMRASITGHLVLSTIHTKDTLGTVYRLLDLGVEPFMLSQGLSTVVAQRLVRQLCPHCKRGAKPTEEQVRKLALANASAETIYQHVGCERCLGTGYSGRRAIFELLSVNEGVREAIGRNAPMSEIAAAAGSRFTKLIHTAYRLVAEGVASFDEVERVVGR